MDGNTEIVEILDSGINGVVIKDNIGATSNNIQTTIAPIWNFDVKHTNNLSTRSCDTSVKQGRMVRLTEYFQMCKFYYFMYNGITYLL